MAIKHALVPFTVKHRRVYPKRYQFTHQFFWFKLDLDYLNELDSTFLSHNQVGFYSFWDKDHLKLGHSSAKENFIQFAKKSGLKKEIKKVFLYTNLRVLGYVFNPVSFVILIDEDDKMHAIIEIGNTFNELKPFFVLNENFSEDGFVYKTKKYFYISPFIKHDNEMTFVLRIEGNKIQIYIDDKEKDQRILQVWFDGKEIPLTTKSLVKQTLRVPFSTIKTILLIHYHAFVLVFMRIKFFKKDEFTELQQGVYPWKMPKPR